MNVLLSVKPKYVNSILKGKKEYEFRKKMFKKGPINFIFIYSSSPVKKIVGYFKLGEIIEDHPKMLWDKLSGVSGLNKEEFLDYFKNKEIGYALKITDLKRFKIPENPNYLIKNFHPPQSFCYVDITQSCESLIKS